MLQVPSQAFTLFYLWQCVGRDLWGGQNITRDFAAESSSLQSYSMCTGWGCVTILGCWDKIWLKEDRNNSLTSFYSSASVCVTHQFLFLQEMPLVFCFVFSEYTLSMYACILSIKSHRFAGSEAIPFHSDISQWRMWFILARCNSL